MRTIFKILIPVAISALYGCVVVPPRAYVGPRVAVVAPAPVVVLRPYYYRYH
jgi:hypothetical protein